LPPVVITVGTMTDKAEWQGRVGDSWAAQWPRTDRSFSALTAKLVAAIAEFGDAHRVVDIGCGAGELSIKLRDAFPNAALLGLDISPELIAVAKQRATDRAQLDFAVADTATWQNPAFVSDLYVSRHGVMFFDDPVAAFSNLAASATPEARMVFSCFRAPAENAWAAEIGKLLPHNPGADPRAPGPFAFADREYVKGILAAAQWTNIEFEAVDFDYIAGAGVDPVGDALDFFRHIGPAARAIRTLEGAARSNFLEQLRDVIAAHRQGEAICFRAAAWIVRARKHI
jgi:SAM-dependent methyltransferase